MVHINLYCKALCTYMPFLNEILIIRLSGYELYTVNTMEMISYTITENLFINSKIKISII